MANKSKSSAKSKKTTKKQSMANRQIQAIVMFTVAVLSLFVLIIEGQHVWKFMHDFLFGMFGIIAFAFPVLIGYIAVLLAIDNCENNLTVKILVAVGLMLFLCTTIDIFTHSVDNIGYFPYLANQYTNGTQIAGGGFFGAIPGYAMSYWFGGIGAKIISILALFIAIMIITGTTLSTLYTKASKPVKKLHNDYIEYKQEREIKKGAKFNIDVPLGDEPAPNTKPKTSVHPELNKTDDKTADDNLNIEDTSAIDKRNNLIMQYNGESESKKSDISQINESIEPKSDNETENSVQTADNSNTEQIESNETDENPTKKKRRTGFVDSVDDLPAAGVTVEVDADYKYPPIHLLKETKAQNADKINDELQSKSDLLVNTLKSFGVETRLVGISNGPSVTRYELQPAAGVKISKITGLANDIALNLAAVGVRIEAPIPGKAAVGIEVPNKLRSSVGIRELLESAVYRNAKSKLCCALGKDITGEIVTMDLAKMPHLLVAGTTGSGKSVCLNSMIISMLYKARPDEVKLIMIDPKSVEFVGYNGIPHLLVPVVTNPQKAAGALGWAVNEMLKRYQIFSTHSVRNITGYNELRKMDDSLEAMPQIVIFIDELADLMMAAPNEVEDSICRLAQMARAAGMHMVIATQSPRTDVITGLIKANIPSRISLTVSNAIDSRVIIDIGGAEKLIGQGDMLYLPIGMNKPLRVQGCFVSDEELNSVVDFLKNQGEETEYDEEIINEMEKAAVAEKGNKDSANDFDDDCDERLNEAVEQVCRKGQASTTFIQRVLKVGYARAARIMDEMEEKGVISASEGAKPRNVLITYNQWLERINGSSDMQEKLPGISDDVATEDIEPNEDYPSDTEEQSFDETDEFASFDE